MEDRTGGFPESTGGSWAAKTPGQCQDAPGCLSVSCKVSFRIVVVWKAAEWRQRAAHGVSPCHYPHLSSVCLNPEGIPSFSPGLRVGELPWVGSKEILCNPEGVAARLESSPSPRRGFGASTPSGLGNLCACAPRVARASQPWAECSNPFRIKKMARRDVGNDKGVSRGFRERRVASCGAATEPFFHHSCAPAGAGPAAARSPRFTPWAALSRCSAATEGAGCNTLSAAPKALPRPQISCRIPVVLWSN